MSFIKSSASAFGKLLTVLILGATFLFGMVGVVYMSLQGEAIQVPELVGKDINESEAELAKLGLKIKERAKRFSNEKQNTILEQLPKSGETVKTGQMILVVVSKENPNGVVPDTIKPEDDEKENIEKIEELISDKPQKNNKANENANKKKSTKTRDVIANKADDANKADKKDGATDKASGDDKKATSTASDKTSTTKSDDKKSDDKKSDDKKSNDKNVKPATAVPGANGTRPRKNP